MKQPDYRSVGYSKTTITELMIPSYANFGGKIHGGIILSLMDKVAYACSAKHAGGYCVTVSMNAVDFVGPVEVGDLVHLHAKVNYVGTSSIVIGVKVEAENVTTGNVRMTNSSYLTMVAMDDHGKPKKVPGLILETKADIKSFLLTKQRRKLIKAYKNEFVKYTSDINVEEEMQLLDGERCMIIDDKG